jgi:hypothetical protein
VSLPALHWRHFQRQAVPVASVVAKLAFESPAGAVLAFAGVALAFCPHCAGVIASIVLLLLLLALCRHHCPSGIVALVAFVLPPASRTGICLVTKQSQHMLESLLASRHHCCRHCAGIVALVARVSLPMLHWRCCPCHTCIAISITKWHLPSHDAVTTNCQ